MSHLSESPSWEVVGPKFKSNQCPYSLWPSTGYLTLPLEPMFFCYATCFPSKWIPREAKGTGASWGRWEWQWHCEGWPQGDCLFFYGSFLSSSPEPRASQKSRVQEAHMAVTMRWVQLFLALHWGLTWFVFPLLLPYWIKSHGGCRGLLPENITKHYKRMSLCIWWGIGATADVPSDSRALWTSPSGVLVQLCASAGKWEKCPGKLSHHQRNLARVVKAHNGDKPNGTLERESWWWKSPMSKSSYGGPDW